MITPMFIGPSVESRRYQGNLEGRASSRQCFICLVVGFVIVKTRKISVDELLPQAGFITLNFQSPDSSVRSFASETFSEEL